MTPWARIASEFQQERREAMSRTEFTVGRRVRLVDDSTCNPRVPVGSVGTVIQEPENPLYAEHFIARRGVVAWDDGTVSTVHHGHCAPA